MFKQQMLMGTGYLIASLTTGNGAFPISKAKITVMRGTSVLYHLTTNDYGNTKTVKLDAPDKKLTLDPKYSGDYYSTYDVKAEADGYADTHIQGVQVFDNETSVLPVQMLPSPEKFSESVAVNIYIPSIEPSKGYGTGDRVC